MRIFRPRLALEDTADDAVVLVETVEAVDERSLCADVSAVRRDSDDERDCGGGDLFATFPLALRLGCGDCVSECDWPSDDGVLFRNITGRSLFSPFTFLLAMLFVGPFCTCFRLAVGVDGADDTESERADRLPFWIGGVDLPFCRGLDILLDIDDLRDDDLLDDDKLLSPLVSPTFGAIFFSCAMRCVGLLMRSTVRRFLVITFWFLNSATRAFRVLCERVGVSFASIWSLVTFTIARDNRWLTLGVTFTFFSFRRFGLVCSTVDFCNDNGKTVNLGKTRYGRTNAKLTQKIL